MSIIGWIILGLIAGFIASKMVNKQGEGVILDIVLGIVGAIVGGFIFTWLGAAGVTDLICGACWWRSLGRSSSFCSITPSSAMSAHEAIAASAHFAGIA